MIALRVLALVGGLVLTLGTIASVVRTVVVPRYTRSSISALVSVGLRAAMGTVARLQRSYAVRDGILATIAPTLLVVRLAVWVGLLVLGFSLLIYSADGGAYAAAIRLSASSMWPLGLEVARSGLTIAIAFLEAASAVIVVALQIAYLPVLYGEFNRRETFVTMLDSSSGSPAWGPEILSRHALIDNLGHLSTLYTDWEQLAADIAESHTSYTSLVYFRSPDPRRSWILALLAVMDAAALQLALDPLGAPATARPFLRMGVVCLRSVCRVVQLPVVEDPHPEDPIELTYEEFQDAVHRMLAAGWELEREPEEAWRHFRGWRVNYEAMAYGLAELVDAPPGPWSGQRHGHVDVSLVPLRPAHREPIKEASKLLEVTRQRRARRQRQPLASADPDEKG